MKVLLLGTRAPGGMATIIDTYMESYLAEKYGLRFVPTHIEANPLTQLFFFVVSVFRALGYMIRPEFRIVHLHTAKHGSLMRKSVFVILARVLGKRSIIHLHGADFLHRYESYGSVMKRFVGFVFRNVSAVIVTSNRRRDEYSRFVDKAKINIIHNFVYLPERVPAPNDDVPRVISLGRLGERKGTYDLIDAISKIRDLPFTVVLAGDGEVDLARQAVTREGLEDRVAIPGWTVGAERQQLLDTGDIFVLPSYMEDMPMAILEAMSYSLPVVSTDVAGIPEMVSDGTSGFLVPAGNADALADRLGRLIADRDLRRRMGGEGRRRVELEFSDTVILEKVSDLYERLGGSHAAA